MNPLCANCFARNPGKHCGKCGCRYCSPECQKQHWRASHKHWCGKAGQWGRDFELRPTPGKQSGIGIFALRPFKKYETIAVDMEITIGPGGQIPDLTDDRLPPGKADRYHYLMKFNDAKLQEQAKTACLILNHINDGCLGNARIMDKEDARSKLNVLKAALDIAAGEEICCPSYDVLDLMVRDSVLQDLGIARRARDEPFRNGIVRQGAREALSTIGIINYGCNCAACTNPDIDQKLGKLYALLKEHDKYSIPTGPVFNVGRIKKNAKKMVALADELGCAPMVYFKIYGTLYNVMTKNGQLITHQEELREILAKLKEISTEWYGPESAEAKSVETSANLFARLDNAEPHPECPHTDSCPE